MVSCVHLYAVALEFVQDTLLLVLFILLFMFDRYSMYSFLKDGLCMPKEFDTCLSLPRVTETRIPRPARYQAICMLYALQLTNK